MIKWRFDRRCGSEYPSPDGTSGPTECDPEGLYPCCSDAKKGWCGNTLDHCTCESCIDYRDLEKWRQEGKCNNQ